MGLDAVGINIILGDPLASLLALIDGVGISIKFVILSLAREREEAPHGMGFNYSSPILEEIITLIKFSAISREGGGG